MNALTTSMTAQTTLHDSAYGGLLARCASLEKGQELTLKLMDIMNEKYMKICHTLIEVFEASDQKSAHDALVASAQKFKDLIRTPIDV